MRTTTGRFGIGPALGLTPMALFLACGGGGSSPPPDSGGKNTAPTNVVIVGPTTPKERHAATYALAATDAEGDLFTFATTTPGATVQGLTLTYSAPASGLQTIAAVATDTRGNSSLPGTLQVNVVANASPVFTSAATAQFTNPSSNVPPSYTYTPGATEPDGDEVVFNLLAGSVQQAVDFAGAPGAFATQADTSIATLNPGTPNTAFQIPSGVPVGASGKRVRFTVRAEDRLGGVLLGAKSDLVVTMTIFALNQPPVIGAITVPPFVQYHSFSGVQLAATDGNGDALTWSLVQAVPAASGLTLSADGKLSWASVPDTILRAVTVKADDLRGGTDTKTFNLQAQPDSLPAITSAAYTETVGGVQFHYPENHKGKIFVRTRFHWSDPLATEAEYLSGGPASAITGWRASILASDAEGDGIRFAVKSGSVTRFGSPFTDAGAPSYPGIDPVTGEITWTPNRLRGTLPADPGDALTNPAAFGNWSFTLVAQELDHGTPIPGQAGQATYTIRVLPNDPPVVGAMSSFVPGEAIQAGVSVGGGTNGTNFGRPALQLPTASEDATPGTPALWSWQVGGPGTPDPAAADFKIADPNTLAGDGHQDALKVDFGRRTLTAGGVVTGPLLDPQAGVHFPLADTTGNLPAWDSTLGLQNGFYNPWLLGTGPGGSFTVKWAPVRFQFLLSRYLGPTAYSFPVVAEDQYGYAANRTVVVYPIFGSLRFFNHRLLMRSDTLPDAVAPLGTFVAAGNTATGGNRYVLSYLPIGVSSAAGNEELLQGGAKTFGVGFFGRADGTGAPASGMAISFGLPIPTAGAWLTSDGANVGAAGLYPSHGLNAALNLPASAAGTPGTPAGATATYSQLRGGAVAGLAGQPTLQSVTVSGPYADNEVRVRTIPSSSPYLFSVQNAVKPVGGDGLTTPRFLQAADQGRRWIYGKAQSEVNFLQIGAGRTVAYSRTPASTQDVNVLQASQNTYARLRLTFGWPAVVSASAPGYPAQGAANAFQETDALQLAVPNLSGNARAFFTGNTPGVVPQGATTSPNNYFGKFGFTVKPTTFTGTGATLTAFPHQPIHAVTDALWLPNNADGSALPNAYTTPVGGGVLADVPFAGLRGWLAPSATTGLNTLLRGTETNLVNTQAPFARLALAGNAGNLSTTGDAADANANPALLGSTVLKDRMFFLWMKQAQGGATPNAYGAFGGTVMQFGTALSSLGGLTTVIESYDMGAGLTNPLAVLSFAAPGQNNNGATQSLNSSPSMQGWNRAQFEALRLVMGAPAAAGAAARVRVADPAADDSQGSGACTATRFDTGANTFDAMTSNSLVIYGLKDRRAAGGRLGEAGLEPGSPVLAQWWNTGATDLPATGFPGVIQAFSSAWLPADFAEVVHVNHNFVGKVQFPGTGGGDTVAKVALAAGLVAPKGHALLTEAGGVRPAVTPVRNLQLQDLKTNHAPGTVAPGTRLDIFNGNAGDPATGNPALGQPSYKLLDGNLTADHRLYADSNLQLLFQPAVSDARHPSGYIVSLYQVTAAGAGPFTTQLTLLREIRMGHEGGRGAQQVLNLPSLKSMAPGNNGQSLSFALKVRTLWIEGDDGAAGHSLDLAKQPFAQGFPYAYADLLSGVFVAAY
ncbi:MAG: hypothetical protein IPL96_12950 [Holophagaceae bacterium]|nr:hypothetical protein [Holophagaceae bacterium]